MALLEGLLRYVELLSLTLWVGGIVFFSFIASPSIFGVLGSAISTDRSRFDVPR